jgi:hypothetical protein
VGIMHFSRHYEGVDDSGIAESNKYY